MGGVSWTGFADPYEQAFTTEAPSGWTVAGGLIRHTATDPSIYLRVLSPDGRTYLLIGDPVVTLFTTPIPILFGLLRAPEGGTVRNYLPGMAFAREYVAQTIPTMCSNVVVTGQRERPDLARGRWTQTNPQARHDAGEVTFTCTQGAEQACGTVAAATYIYLTPSNMGGALWSIDYLVGFIAPPDGCEAAEALNQHIIASTHLSSVWYQGQQEMTAQVVRGIDANTQQKLRRAQQNLANVNQITTQIAEQQRARANERQHQMDQQFESFDRIITGTSPYADSAGNVYQLDNTQPYHWIGPNGVSAVTAGPTPPLGLGWEQMKEVPPE